MQLPPLPIPMPWSRHCWHGARLAASSLLLLLFFFWLILSSNYPSRTTLLGAPSFQPCSDTYVYFRATLSSLTMSAIAIRPCDVRFRNFSAPMQCSVHTVRQVKAHIVPLHVLHVSTKRIGLCSVLRPSQHSIGYGRRFYRSRDQTNGIKVLKEMLQEKENNETN